MCCESQNSLFISATSLENLALYHIQIDLDHSVHTSLLWVFAIRSVRSDIPMVVLTF